MNMIQDEYCDMPSDGPGPRAPVASRDVNNVKIKFSNLVTLAPPMPCVGHWPWCIVAAILLQGHVHGTAMMHTETSTFNIQSMPICEL